MDGLDLTCDIRMAQCEIKDRTAFLNELRDIARKYTTHISCFNADMVAGRAHVQSAVEHAVRAFREGAAISNTIEMESLLYAAGSRQCNIASPFGVHTGLNHLYVCCYPTPGKEVWECLPQLFRFSVEKDGIIDSEKKACLMQLFEITTEEVEAHGNIDSIVDLVLERVALLNVLR